MIRNRTAESIEAEANLIRTADMWFREAVAENNLGNCSATQALYYTYADMLELIKADEDAAKQNPLIANFFPTFHTINANVIADQVMPQDPALVNIEWHRQAVDPALFPIVIGERSELEIENGRAYGQNSILGVLDRMQQREAGFEVHQGVHNTVFAANILAFVEKNGHNCDADGGCPSKVSGTCGSSVDRGSAFAVEAPGL